MKQILYGDLNFLDIAISPMLNMQKNSERDLGHTNCFSATVSIQDTASQYIFHVH